ncbi:MAG: BON domain-containing protein [Thiobacillus sp.]|nr:BON domain-containing protein [Thiobacillus sp.]
MSKLPVRELILTALLGLGAVQLSGCVPVVAVGAGAGIMMAEDRRTSGTYLMDEEIELKAIGRIRESFGKEVHVNVTSFNRRVMLTGEVPNDEIRGKVRETVAAVPNVREVINESVIGGTSSFGARSNDAYLTAKVKTRLFDDKRFNGNHVKVVTEAGTTFLMGLVKRDEGDAAAEVAARTKGVNKVVKVFEYME